MLVEQEIAELVGGEVDGVSAAKVKETVQLAIQQVARILSETNCTYLSISSALETATTKVELVAALKIFNPIMRILFGIAPGVEHGRILLDALLELGFSARFTAYLLSAATLREAVTGYKTTIMQELAVVIRQEEDMVRREETLDSELFSQFLPEPSPVPVDKASGEVNVALSRKRGSSLIAGLELIPKKKRALAALPALAALDGGDAATSRKKTLVTREKLRAGIKDPRGLLDLGGPSTNALERTKTLELLKCAGYRLDNEGKKTSFLDRLDAAKHSQDVGLGAQSLRDTLLFGATVMSSQGFLSQKNISDVENNRTVGNTTWKHQHAYCKMAMAGCLNQAKDIVKKFDDVLYGPAPESLIGDTHLAIRELLKSDDCGQFRTLCTSKDRDSVLFCDTFVHKVIGAVSPIIPIVLRNKSLDGTYLRTALNLLGCTEFLLSQYENDIRGHANPNGVVGMCSAMLSKFKEAAVFGKDLKQLDDFMLDMKSQYQTSLGLGTPFNKDSGGTRARSRRRSGFDRPRGNFGRPRRFQGRPDLVNNAQGSAGELNTFGGPMRFKGVCFAYLAGTCRRGNTCRYRHDNK